MLGTIALVVLVIFLFLRRFIATVIPTLSLPVSLFGAVACCGASATPSTTSRCWA
jgi:HAE1 family hydrophobic/amphiphilic exporter-1